jgi:hypothetical protein
MPSCPECHEEVTLIRWLRTSGRGMDLHTRCNRCGRGIRAYIPWHISIPWFLAPLLILVVCSNLVPNFSGLAIVALLLWQFASIPLGYIWFGKVVTDE